MKKSLLVFICFIVTIQIGNAKSILPPLPVTITAFAPLRAAPASILTITGAGFSNTAASNTVYFGSVKAVVTAASTNSLTVTVPFGSMFTPITVTNTESNFTAVSAKHFHPTFSTSKSSFTDTDLSAVRAFTAGTNTVGVAFGDLDGDGKPDIVAVNKGSNTLSILQNNWSSGVVAANSFSKVTDLHTNTAPSDVHLADMNNDGKLDMIVNSSVSQIRVFLNTSTGTGNFTFATGVDYNSVQQANHLAITDVDGDGRLDILGINRANNQMMIMRNIGIGAAIDFDNPTNFATGTEPAAIAIGDLDGDGKPDIAVANYIDNNVSVFLNTSVSGEITSTSLAATQTFTVGGKPQGIAIGDIDGDGKMEIVTSYWAGSGVNILANTSSGLGNISFSSAAQFYAGSSTYWISLADMNGDGKLDIVASDQNGFIVIPNQTTLGNITTAGFSTQTRFSANGSPRVFVGDLNGDGKPEVVATNGTVSLFQNTLSVPAVITSVSPLKAAPGATITISGTDFDPIASNNTVYFGATKVAASTAIGKTQLTVTVPSGANFGPLSIHNKINKTIAYSAEFFQPVFSPYKTSFSSDDLAPKLDFATGTKPNSVISVDIDGDGKPDLLTANYLTNSISMLLNASSTGAFDASSLNELKIIPGISVGVLAIGDINMDGKPDIILGHSSSDYIRVYINTSTVGSPSFTVSSDFDLGYDGDGITSLAIADIDGDGKPDIIGTVNATSYNVAVLRNKTAPGSSIISLANTYSFNVSGTRLKRMAIGDLDGDGKPEIVVTHYTVNYTEGTGSKVSVLTNQSNPGSIKFATSTSYTTGTGPYQVALGDMDGDGKLDIVTSNLANTGTGIFGNTVSILRNTGSGFAAFESFPTGNGPQGVVLADMNGDGKLDIITSNVKPTENSISVLNNNSSPGSLDFSTSIDFETGVLPTLVVANDLDGDGKPEIITANYTDNTVSVFKNTLNIPAPVISSFTPTSGISGTTITITGTDFSATSSVKFGGVEAASYTVVSSTSIIAVSGAGNSGDISVTTPSGIATVEGFTHISSDATLASFSLSDGTLSPTFSSTTTAYTANVANGVSSITITPTVNEANATLEVNGFAVSSGTASAVIPLTVGANTITTVVTAQDGTATKTYTITVTRDKANQTITFTALQNKTFGDADFNLSATGGASGTALSYNSSNTAVATVSGNTVTIIGAGSTDITASQLGNTDYNAATDVTQSLTVNKANQTITFTLIYKTLGDADFEPLATTTSALPITYTSSNTTVATVAQDATDGNKWKVKLWSEGSTDITALQAGDNNYNPASLFRTLTVATTLPVELNVFTAKVLTDGTTQLNWDTFSERNNDYFQLSRSVDGQSFTVLGTIKGSGTSNQLNKYSFSDRNPINGDNYYRLTQVDLDGSKKNIGLKVLNVSLAKDDVIMIYPNPTSNTLNITFQAGKFSIAYFTDVSGKTITKRSISNTTNKLSFEIGNLPPAVYIINLYGNGKSFSKQIIKK